MQLSTALNLPNRQLGAGGFGYGASLSLDFTTGNQTLDSRITFTRASTATRTNASGIIESVATNTARFDYNPATLAPLGLLIEESRTNLILQSEDCSASPWTTASPYSVTTNTAISPDGTQDADSVILASGQTSFNQNVTRQLVTKSASAIQYTRSGYFKKLGATTSVRLQDFGNSSTNAASVVVSLVDGSIVTAPSVIGGFSGASVAVTNAGNGWWRIAFTYTTDAHTSLTIRSFPYVGAGVLTGDGSSGLLEWGAQLEAGAFATSYIPTVASQVTRAADNAVMTGTNFSSWYNQTEGTLFTESRCPNGISGNINRIASLNDGTASNRIEMDTGTVANTVGRIQAGGVSQGAPSAGSYTDFQLRKSALAIQVDNFTLAANTSLNSDTSALVPAVNRLMIGQSPATSSSYLNGTIRRIAYYPRRLSNAELQGITA